MENQIPQPNPQVPNQTSSQEVKTPMNETKNQTKVILENIIMKVKPLLNRAKYSWDNLNPKFKKLILIVFGVFGFFVLVALILGIIASSQKRSGSAKVTPTPVVNATELPEVLTNPSRYATDSGVLKIGESLNTIEKELNSTEIKDLKLSLPNVTFDINFEE